VVYEITKLSYAASTVQLDIELIVTNEISSHPRDYYALHGFQGLSDVLDGRFVLLQQHTATLDKLKRTLESRPSGITIPYLFHKSHDTE
jgi:hypothetical protein